MFKTNLSLKKKALPKKKGFKKGKVYQNKKTKFLVKVFVKQKSVRGLS